MTTLRIPKALFPAILGAALCLAPLPAKAREAEPSLKDCGIKPEITVKYEPSKVKTRWDLDGDGIRQLTGGRPPIAGYHLSGLYRPTVNLGYRYTYKTLFKRGNKKPVCIHSLRVQVTYTVEREIFLNSKYKRGTCYYNVILRHEERHMKFDDETTRIHLPRWKAALTRDMTRSKGFKSEAEMAERLKTLIDQHVETLNLTKEKLHATIDNQKNYDREASLCPENARK